LGRPILQTKEIHFVSKGVGWGGTGTKGGSIEVGAKGGRKMIRGCRRRRPCKTTSGEDPAVRKNVEKVRILKKKKVPREGSKQGISRNSLEKRKKGEEGQGCEEKLSIECLWSRKEAKGGKSVNTAGEGGGMEQKGVRPEQKNAAAAAGGKNRGRMKKTRWAQVGTHPLLSWQRERAGWGAREVRKRLGQRESSSCFLS